MKKIKTHLQYFWWIYLLLAAVFISLWCIVFSSLAKPAENEKLVISYFGEGLDCAKLGADISDNISDITDQSLKSTSVAFVCKDTEPLLMPLIQARLLTSDVLIIAENILTDELVAGNFKELPEQTIGEYLGDPNGVELYYVYGKPYGVVLTPEGVKNNFSMHYSAEQSCVAFFCPDSANLAAMYGKGEQNDDAALCIIKYLLEVKE